MKTYTGFKGTTIKEEIGYKLKICITYIEGHMPAGRGIQRGCTYRLKISVLGRQVSREAYQKPKPDRQRDS